MNFSDKATAPKPSSSRGDERNNEVNSTTKKIMKNEALMSNDNNIRMNRHRVLSDITDVIGSTPLVDLSRLTKHYCIRKGKIYAKIEYLNPGYSKKDRIAKQIIQNAKASGKLQNGQTVIELTSGNTGTGLAIVCSILGHPFIAVMSKGNSIERVRMMKALGANVVLVDQAPTSTPGQVSGEDLQLVEKRTQQLTLQHNAYRANQFINKANYEAHYYGTGPEIWEQSNGNVTHFVDFVGTGGSFGGCSKYLKPKGVQCYIVEPTGAAILNPNNEEVIRPNHKIQGGGYMYSMDDLPCIDFTKDVDGYLQVTDDDAIQATRNLAKFEGIFGGFSAGANVAAAIQLLKKKQEEQEQHQEEGAVEEEKEQVVAILICDSGLKYLSTDLWE